MAFPLGLQMAMPTVTTTGTRMPTGTLMATPMDMSLKVPLLQYKSVFSHYQLLNKTLYLDSEANCLPM